MRRDLVSGFTLLLLSHGQLVLGQARCSTERGRFDSADYRHRCLVCRRLPLDTHCWRPFPYCYFNKNNRSFLRPCDKVNHRHIRVTSQRLREQAPAQGLPLTSSQRKRHPAWCPQVCAVQNATSGRMACAQPLA